MPASPNESKSEFWIDGDHEELFARNGIAGVDDLFAVAGTKLHKATLPKWRERVAVEFSDDDGTSRRFYIKRFNRDTPKRLLNSMLGGKGSTSPARIERDWISRLREAGIPVPKVAAFAEESLKTGGSRSALVLAEVPGESLERWVLSQQGPASKSLIHTVADLARSFHWAGFIHRDFYLSHIFLTNDSENNPALALIDLQRVMHKPIRFERWRNRDLAQLDYSVPDHIAGARQRVRFLRRYFQVRSLRRSGHVRTMKAIVRKSAQIAAHDRRRQSRTTKAGAV
ncbi:MAG: hypothetical protein DHS20C16_24700 [Phycisphaerae bacterium]|nr:MAG: hypothetical protein DHS20C16_24700 [Phycisphaerae bacterium]